MDHGMSMPSHAQAATAASCKTHMLWNAAIIDTCVVFRWWHITSAGLFVLSCVGLAALSVAFEGLRAVQRALDARIARALAAGTSHKTAPLDENPIVPVPAVLRALRALVYGAIVFVSLFLMLVFMTYNVYLIVSVVVGAMAGHYIFSAKINLDACLPTSSAAAGNGLACH